MIAEITQHPNFVSFNYNGRRMLYEKITSSIYRGEGVKINALEKELQAQTYTPRYDPEPFIAFCNNKKIESIVLNVTEACNFRCKYCIYSGLYKGERTHSFKSMTLDTALKSLDVLLPHTSDLLVVSFYGGEPLLNFNLIKAVTEYLDKNLKGSSKKLVYSLTTNGSLLARHLDFLIEKEFQIAVSIDGPKALHDSRRVYANSGKSFDDVYSNIELLISKHPEFSKTHLMLMGTYLNESELNSMINFFKNLEESIASIRLNYISTKNIEYLKSQNLNIQPVAFGTFLNLGLSFLNSFLNGNSSKTLENLFVELINNFVYRDRSIAPQTITLLGSCCPGKRRVFINTDGKFYACEKTSGKALLGDMETGIDFQTSNQLIRKITSIRNSVCKDCWAARICKVCLLDLKDENSLSQQALKTSCTAKKNRLLLGLLLFSHLLYNEGVKKWIDTHPV